MRGVAKLKIDLENLLNDSKPARLIPTITQTRKEERLVSVLLGTLGIVRPLAEDLLGRCGVRLGLDNAVSPADLEQDLTQSDSL